MISLVLLMINLTEKVTDAKVIRGQSNSNIERVIGRKGGDVLDITGTDFVFQNIELQGNDGNYLSGNDGMIFSTEVRV